MARGSAIAAFALWLSGLFLAGPPPKTSDPVGELIAILTDHRRELIVGTYLVAAGTLAFLVFLAAVVRHLRDDLAAPEPASVAGHGGVARAVTDTVNVIIALANLGGAALIGAVTAAVHASGPPRGWLVRSAPPVTLLLLASTLAPFLFDTGAWQFGGIAPIAGMAPAVAWVIALAFHLPTHDEEST